MRFLPLVLAFCGVLAQGSTPTPLEFQGVFSEDLTLLKAAGSGVDTTTPSLADTDRVLQILFETGKYESLQVVRDTGPRGTFFRIEAEPARTIRRIRIKGNSELEDGEVLGVLGLMEGERFSRYQYQAQTATLRSLYAERGHSQATAEVKVTDDSPQTVTIDVQITEGPPTLLTSLIVETTNEGLRRRVLGFLERFKGRKMTEAVLTQIRDELRSRLNSEQYFTANVQIQRSSIPGRPLQSVIRVTIENPYTYSLVFSDRNPFDDFVTHPPGRPANRPGGQIFSYSDLVRALDINNQDRFGSNLAAELSDRLRTFLKARGHAQAQVTAEEKQLPDPFSKQIRIKVIEGPLVQIESIEFSGRFSQNQDQYRDLMISPKGTPVLDHPYVAEDLEKALANLTVALQNRGHLKARVLSSRTEFSTDKRKARVFVFMDEGPLTRLKGIRFSGNRAFPTDELASVLKLKESDGLRLNVLEAGLIRLRDFYLDRGYLDFTIKNEKDLIQYSEDSSEAEVLIDLREGPQVKVGSVLVEGNSITDSSVILRETELTNGEILNRERISEIEYRLERLGLFSGVRVDTLEKGTNLDRRTVVIRVSDRNPGLFNTGVGANNELVTNEIVLKAYSGIAYRNLRGKGRAVSFRGEVQRSIQESSQGFIQYSVNLGYLEPFMFNRRIRGRTNLLRKMEITSQTSTLIKGLETNELTFNLEKDLDRYWKFTWNFWNFASTRVFAIRGIWDENKLNIGSFGPIIEWDRRDNPFNPSRGLYFSTNVEYSNPLIGSSRTVHYWRTSGVFNTYLQPFSGTRWIWASSVRGGYESNLSQLSDGEIPDVKRFSLGGRASLRAFDPETVPYEDEIKFQRNIAREKSVGVKFDSHFYLLKTEVQFPIFGDVWGAFFYDGGAVQLTGIQLEDAYRDGWGLGARWITPVGPVSLDLAFKLDRRENWQVHPGRDLVTEAPWRINFYIGSL